MNNIPLFYPFVAPDAGIKVADTLKTKWIGQADKVDEFEDEFARVYGYQFCVAVNSGTSALELAYHLVGIEEGDEVITPVFTCTATNIPLLRRNATLKFADIDDNLTISYKSVKKLVSDKTKAIVVVTLGGISVDKRIFKLAQKKKIPVIIDAAQSLGIKEKWGDYICYSFQAIKHFTTADGGMLVVKRKDDYKRAKKLRWFGIDREVKKRNDWQPYKDREMIMDIEEAGYKYHMNDVTATIGLCAIKHTDRLLQHRQFIGETYKKKLKCKVICSGSYWLCAVLVNNRDKVAEKLYEVGIETNPVQLRNDIFTIFGKKRQEHLKMMNKLEHKILYLPIHHKMTLDDVEYVIKAFNKIYEKFRRYLKKI